MLGVIGLKMWRDEPDAALEYLQRDPGLDPDPATSTE